MRFPWVFAVGGVSVVLAACGLEEGGLLHEEPDGAADGPPVVVDAGKDVTLVDDAGIDASVDSSVDAPPDVGPDAPIDAPPDVVDAGCPLNACANVPNGWNPVAYKEGTKACPGGTTGNAYATKPTPVAGSCTCGCALTSSSACDVGKSQTSYSTNPNTTCSTPSVAHVFATSGQCLPLNGSFSDYYGATAIARSGGTCSASPSQGTATATDVALCTPTVCKEAICANVVPLGYTSCIETTGDTACPSNTPYTKLVTVGDTPAVTCGAGCGCNLTGTCTSPKITYYTDTNCTNVAQSFAADGTCQAVTFGGTVRGVTYSATLTGGGCTATGSSTATPTLQNHHTVCCRP